MFIIEISRREIKDIVYRINSLRLKIKIVNRVGFICITDGKIIFFKTITSLAVYLLLPVAGSDCLNKMF